MRKYVELNGSNFAGTIKEGVVLVDFWAPWCGPCRMMSPVIVELVEEFEGKAVIAKFNTDENLDIPKYYGINSIPTILFFKDGKLVDRIVGAAPKQALVDKLNKFIKTTP